MADLDLTITRPCPVDLDARGVDRSGPRFFCEHCARDVHVLSNMSREAAERFVAERRGERVCVSYRRVAGGRILFADDDGGAGEAVAAAAAPLVPTSRLRRAGALPRAAGVALLVAACAPHGDAPHGDAPAIDDDPIEVRAEDRALGIVVQPTVAPPGAILDDEPCHDEAPTAAPAVARRDPAKRPRRQTRKEPKIEVIDGLLF